MQKRFERSIHSLNEIFEFVAKFLVESGIDESMSYPLNLAIEELFTNMVKYNPENPNRVSIDLIRDEGQIAVCLTDFDVDPFDMTSYPRVDTNAAPEDRQPGGLGIHLARCMVDEIRYDYRDRTSKITITKRLRS